MSGKVASSLGPNGRGVHEESLPTGLNAKGQSCGVLVLEQWCSPNPIQPPTPHQASVIRGSLLMGGAGQVAQHARFGAGNRVMGDG